MLLCACFSPFGSRGQWVYPFSFDYLAFTRFLLLCLLLTRPATNREVTCQIRSQQLGVGGSWPKQSDSSKKLSWQWFLSISVHRFFTHFRIKKKFSKTPFKTIFLKGNGQFQKSADFRTSKFKSAKNLKIFWISTKNSPKKSAEKFWILTFFGAKKIGRLLDFLEK